MNNKDFTFYGLENTSKRVVCIKSKPIYPDNLEFEGLHEYEVGERLTFVGFICCQDEQTVIIETDKNSQDCVDYSDFLNFFEILKDPFTNQHDHFQEAIC